MTLLEANGHPGHVQSGSDRYYRLFCSIVQIKSQVFVVEAWRGFVMEFTILGNDPTVCVCVSFIVSWRETLTAALLSAGGYLGAVLVNNLCLSKEGVFWFRPPFIGWKSQREL